jgi:glutathionyl-hydroquinone reductase
MIKPGSFRNVQSPEGDFKRQEDSFRDWVKADGSPHSRRRRAAIISMYHSRARGLIAP